MDAINEMTALNASVGAEAGQPFTKFNTTIINDNDSDFVISVCLYGMDTMDVNIQSFPEFRNCTLTLTVGEYYVVYLLAKIFSILAFSGIFALIFAVFSNAFFKYIVSCIVIGLSFTLYIIIPSESPLNLLKYINFFYFTDTTILLSKYLNLNIFNEAVNINLIFVLTILIMLIISVCIVSILFVKGSFNTKNNGKGLNFENIRKKFFKINGSTKLINGELFKYFIQNKYAILFILLVAFSVFNSFGQEEYNYNSKSDYIYKTHMEYLQGEITQNKLEYIKEKEEYIAKLQRKLNNPNISEGMIDVISNIIENETKAIDNINAQCNRILNLKSQNIDARFVDENIYSNFIYNPQRELLNFAFLAILLIVSVPIVYTGEYKNGVISLIRPNKNGKIRLWIMKLLVGFFVTLLCVVCVYIPYFIRFTNTYGVNCFSYPLNVIGKFESGVTVSILGAYLTEMITCLFIAVFTFALITLVSVFMENNLISMLMSSVFLLIPTAVMIVNDKLRIGSIFTGNWVVEMILIIAIIVSLSTLLFSISGSKFTGTNLLQSRGKYET